MRTPPSGTIEIGKTPRRNSNSRGETPHIAILGSGSGAFATATRAAEGGARVTMIEAGTLGGTCVNVGCVPSKILLRAAHVAHLAGDHPFRGIERRRLTVDRAALTAQQQGRVDELRGRKYADVLAAYPNIELVRGFGRFRDARTLTVRLEDGETRLLRPDRVLIATGAEPWVPPIPGLAETPYWISTEALFTEETPERLLVLGGSFVAVELAQAFSRLGSEVTILARSSLLSQHEPALGQGLREALEDEGIRVLGHTVPSAVRHEEGEIVLEVPDAPGGEVRGDRLLMATGRRPRTDGIGLDKAGVALDATGAVVIDPTLRTSAEHVYAVGDCTALPQLVYVAAAAGTQAAANMLGGDGALDLSVVPVVVFTDPQVATVGLTEDEARSRGLAVESRSLSLADVPRALANFDTRGFVKLVAEEGSGRLLGAQVLAAAGGEVIQAAAMALTARMTIHDLTGQLFPYLTMVEALKLCALSFTRDVQKLSCCAA